MRLESMRKHKIQLILSFIMYAYGDLYGAKQIARAVRKFAHLFPAHWTFNFWLQHTSNFKWKCQHLKCSIYCSMEWLTLFGIVIFLLDFFRPFYTHLSLCVLTGKILSYVMWGVLYTTTIVRIQIYTIHNTHTYLYSLYYNIVLI